MKIEVEKKATTFILPATLLRAAKTVAADDNEIRTFLQGVFVDRKTTGETTATTLVATNGHSLLWLEAPTDSFVGDDCLTDCDPKVQAGMLLKFDHMDKAFKVKTIGDLWVYGDITTGLLQFFVNYTGPDTYARFGVLEFERLDQHYAPWRRVLPEKVPSELPSRFDVSLLDQLMKAVNTITKTTSVRMFPAPEGACTGLLLEFPDVEQAHGVLMPQRDAA